MPKECRSCHQSLSDTSFYARQRPNGSCRLTPDCKACHSTKMSIAKRLRFAAHPEKRLAATRKEEIRQRKYPEALRAKWRRAHARRREYRNTQRRRRFQLYVAWHHALYLARQRAYRIAHREELRAYDRLYRPAYRLRTLPRRRELARAHAKHRRAIKRGAVISDLSAAQTLEIKQAYGLQCVYCHAHIPLDDLTIDHITPLAKQGNHTLHNIVPACLSCNVRKQDGPPPVPVQPLLLTLAAPVRRHPQAQKDADVST